MAKKPLSSDEVTRTRSTGSTSSPAISGGPGTRKPRNCFRNSPRAAGRICITTPSPFCTRCPSTNCASGCRTRTSPAMCARCCRISTATWPTRRPGARKHAPALLKNPVAYFSAEFGFHETLPIAAGGLGILAGDHAKSASDLGLGFVRHQPVLPRRLFPAGHQCQQLADGILLAAESEESADRTGAGRAAANRWYARCASRCPT